MSDLLELCRFAQAKRQRFQASEYSVWFACLDGTYRVDYFDSCLLGVFAVGE
jgi:hypothetical protein